MSFSGKICAYALATAVFVAVSGCSPAEQGSLDDEKEPHFVLGKSRVNAMDYTGAVEAFEESLEVDPHSAAAHFELGWLFEEKVSDPAAAIYHYEQYLKLQPDASNGDVIRQRIDSCKQQLATDVLQLPSTPAAQEQLEKLVEQNRQLQSQVDQLNAAIKQWTAYYASEQARAAAAPASEPATPVPQPQVSLPTPDDMTAQPVVATQPTAPTSGNSRPTAAKTRPRSRTHTVAAGETLAAIARKTGVSLTALQEANPGLNAKKLHVGQVVYLPSL
jgi:LysM repeat protein